MSAKQVKIKVKKPSKWSRFKQWHLKVFHSKRNIVIAYVCLFLILTSLGAVGTTALLNWRPSIEPGSNNQSFPEPSRTPEQHRDKYMNVLVCGVHEGLSDVMMLVNFNFDTGKINILQIPRDTFVNEKIITGKMNAVYSTAKQGDRANALIRKINEMFQLPVDRYVTITLKGFEKCVDLIGGVEVDIPTRITFGGVTLYPGKQTINGRQAITLVRSRKGIAGGDGGDLGRMQSQSYFLRGLAKKVLNGKTNFVLDVLPKIYKEVTTDFSVRDAADLVGMLNGFSEKNMESFILPGYSHYYKSYAVYSLDRQKTADLLNQHFRINGEVVPYTELQIIDARSLSSNRKPNTSSSTRSSTPSTPSRTTPTPPSSSTVPSQPESSSSSESPPTSQESSSQTPAPA